MKLAIQRINNQIRHDFAFTLIESARFQNWLTHSQQRVEIRYKNTETDDNDVVQPFGFKNNFYKSYIPIGSVEFVTQHLQEFHGLTPKPQNVPVSLFPYANRHIFNGTEKDIQSMVDVYSRTFVKSNDVIKGFTEVFKKGMDVSDIPKGNYQISYAINIDSEWRAFIYKGKLVGLQHYVGEFTLFPDVQEIKSMITHYENSKEAPIAYTLDVGIDPTLEVDGSHFNKTFVIEVHDFFSCGLYGFSNHAILPQMFGRWFTQYVNKNKKP